MTRNFITHKVEQSRSSSRHFKIISLMGDGLQQDNEFRLGIDRSATNAGLINEVSINRSI